MVVLATVLIILLKLTSRNGPPLPPGPSGWPLIGSLPLMGKRPHHSLSQLLKQYGPIMQLKLGMSNALIVSSSKMAEVFLKSNNLNFSNRLGNSSSKYRGYDCRGLVMVPYGPYCRILRKITNIHLFATKVIDDSQSVWEAEVGLQLKTILDHEQ